MKRIITLHRLAITGLTACLLVVTAGYQSARRQAEAEPAYRAAYHDALVKLWRQRPMVQKMAQKQQAEDAAYIAFLEESLSRYQDGDPSVWRPYALKRAEVIKRETEEERAAREVWEMRENGYLPPRP